MAGASPSNVTSSYSNASTQAGANKASAAAQNFDLKATINAERAATQTQNNQLDPAVLARIALEEELKKKGGGGGGGRTYNPTTWVPYSFSLLAKAIDQARLAVAQAVLTAIDNVDQALQGGIQQTGNIFATVARPINKALNFIFVGFAQNTFNLISNFAKNPINFSVRMANNIAQTGIAIFAAVVNGLKKIIYGKDEAIVDPDEEIYKEEGGALSMLLNFFTLKDEDNESNGKNIKSHLNNKAKQITQRKTKKDFVA